MYNECNRRSQNVLNSDNIAIQQKCRWLTPHSRLEKGSVAQSSIEVLERHLGRESSLLRAQKAGRRPTWQRSVDQLLQYGVIEISPCSLNSNQN